MASQAAAAPAVCRAPPRARRGAADPAPRAGRARGPAGKDRSASLVAAAGAAAPARGARLPSVGASGPRRGSPPEPSRSSTAPPLAARGGPAASPPPPEQRGSRRVPCIDVGCARRNEEVLVQVAEKLGWGVCRGGSSGTVAWVVRNEDVADWLLRLRPRQLLSHIPGMSHACGKVSLARGLQAQGADFWPRSWRVPEFSAQAIVKDAFATGEVCLIVKPDGGSHGEGIHLARTRDELRRGLEKLLFPAAIVQEYVDRPLLLDGYKWDCRLYALVMPSPRGGLSCWLAREGLVRVCIDPYEAPVPRNLHKLTVHLTNYSLSKFSEKFVFSDDAASGDSGCKRALSAVLSGLEARGSLGGGSAESLWERLESLARQTVDAMASPLTAAGFNPATWEGSEEVALQAQEKFERCFQIVGMDVLLDEGARPWLLEVNNNPSLSVDEIRPLEGCRTRAEVNQVFAAAKRESGQGPKRWGQPCRCSKHPRPHAHYECPVDVAVKVPVVEGTLLIVSRASERARAGGVGPEPAGGGAPEGARWAEGTIFRPV
ncbi:unnamed protein product [Prorocentrum cordatum]|uniref:Tubulin--tyrosine ligase-like protein 9 n=1 Tax=Prorocentrum cordatum TaxID=2364126 RepID=A0ABN9W6Q1_9DINO|nr:unnamed protein product [Polarella glacialis]